MSKKRTICYNIKASWHTISRMYNSHAVDHDSSISVGYVLLNLHRENGIPSTQIAPQLGMEPRSLTRLLKAMEQNGLIRKEADKIDKRQVNVFLTEKGYKQRLVAKKTVKEFNQVLSDQIDEADLKTFQNTLEKIIRITEQNFKTSI